METGELFELESLPVRLTRDGLAAFMFHESRHGPRVFSDLEQIATLAKERGWNLPVGSITLVCAARFNVKGFTLCNSLAPFYVAALAIMRPDLRGVLAFGGEFSEALREAGWKPSKPIEGGRGCE